MAMRKKKAKGKKKRPGRTDADRGQTADAAGGSEDGGAEEEGDDEPDDGADSEDAPEPAPQPRSRAQKSARQAGPVVDPNIPMPGGDNVSNSGGLVFVIVILALIGVAIAAQFIVGG